MRNLYLGIYVLFIALFSMQTSKAQCDVGFPTSNIIDLYLDNNGNATLNENFISTYIGTGFPDCNIITLYDADMNPIPGNSLVLDCDSVGTSIMFFVTLTDITTPYPESPLADFFINVIDNTPPMLTCPESTSATPFMFVVNTDANSCVASLTDVELAPDVLTDNCSDNVFLYDNLTWVWERPLLTDSSGVGSFDNQGLAISVFTVGHHEITYTAVDASGNESMCTFTIDVTDIEAPIALCPIDNSFSAEEGVCTADSLSNISMTAGPAAVSAGEYFENCDSVRVEYQIGGMTTVARKDGTDAGLESFNLGTSMVTYYFTDEVGNTFDCTFNVEITDDEIPTIDTTQMDFTVHTSGSIPYTCDADTTITHPLVMDNCGINLASYTVEVNQTLPIAGNIIPTNSIVAGGTTVLNTLSLGTYEVVYNVDDQAGNSAISFTYNFTVIDDEAPVFNTALYDDMVIDVVSSIGSCNEEVDWNRPAADVAMDNCPGSLTVTETIISGPDMTVLDGVIPFMPLNPTSPGQLVDAIFPVGTTVIEYAFTDTDGNVVSKTVTINVTDETPPVALCNATVTAELDAAGNATITPAMLNNNSYDNCGTITMSLDQTDFDCTDISNPVTVTLTVSDTSTTSLDATCMSEVSVVDLISPVIISCPSDTIIETNGNSLCEATATWTHPSVSDNCDVMTRSWSADGGTTTSTFTDGATATITINENTTITYNVVDSSGNSNICAFVITINDNDAPVLAGMPLDITLNANAACSAVHTWIEPTATDNCTAATDITIISNISSGNTFGIGIHTVTYTAFDTNGNVATESFDVTVSDNQEPIAQCEDITIYLDNTAGAGSIVLDTSLIDDGSSDNCGIQTMTLSQDTFTCTDIGDNTVMMTVSDGFMNATCSSTVTVLDTFAPVCQTIVPGKIFYLDASGMINIAVADIDSLSTDNCTISSMLISIDGGAFVADQDFTCTDASVHTVDLMLVDQSSNESICSTTIEIKDNSAPTFTVPADITIQCDQNENDLNITGNVTNINDTCDPMPVVTYDDVIAITYPTTYIITRTWTLTDASNNATSQDQIITVEDTWAPTTTVASTIEVMADSLTCTGTISQMFTDVNTFDNCSPFDSLSITNYSLFAANASYDISGEYPIGTTTVIVTITDESNNTLFHNIEITVTDDSAPTVTFVAADITQDNLTENCFATVFFPRPNSSMVSDCSGPGSITITESIDNYTVVPLTMFDSSVGGLGVADFPVGVTTVSYEFSDGSGNTETVSFTVTVLDVQGPSISCPANQTLGTVCASGLVPDYTNLVANLISDNCPNWNITQSPLPGTSISSLANITPADGESFPVTITVTDNLDNMLSDSCTFDVQLSNSQDPIAPSLIHYIDSCGTTQVPTPVGMDNCGSYNIYGIPNNTSFTILGTTDTTHAYFYDPGSYVVIWTFLDNDNNSTQTTQLITIAEDTTAPVVNCPADVTVFNTPTLCTAENVANIGITYTDHCGVGNVSYTLTMNGSVIGSGTGADAGVNETFNKGTTTVTYTITDGSNNSSSCSVDVTVEDNEGPVLSGIPASITADCDDIPAVANITSIDNCDGNLTASVSTTIASGTCPETYIITRTWTSTDSEDNSTSESQQILVQDLEAPMISSFPSNIDVNNDFGQCGATINLILSDVFLSDNCAPVSSLAVTNNYTTNGNNASGFYDIANSPHVVTFMVTDPCGNVNSHDVTITVTDNQAPTPVCINNISLPVGGLDSVVITSANININSFDNCTPQNSLTFELDQTTFDCNDVDNDLNIVMTVTDLNGNSAYCTTTVEIQDNIAPIITCPADILILCSDSTDPNTNSNLGTPTASDNCSVTTSYTDATINSNGSDCYTIERTWTASDNYGNEMSCIQYITIEDNTDPMLSQGPTSLTLGCSENVPSPSTLTGTDNCDNNVSVSYSETSTQGANGCSKYNYNISRVWIAEDNCGNTDSYTQFIDVNADDQPTFLPGIIDTVNATAHVTIDSDCGISDEILDLDLTNLIDAGCYDHADLYRRVHVVENNNQPLVGNGFLNANGQYPHGQYHIVYSLGDPCGTDTLFHTIVLNVTEDFSPTAICNDQLVVGLGSDGTVTITEEQLNNGSYDNCTDDADLIFTVINGTFDCSQLGEQEVTMSVEDESGNITTCTSVVTITSDPNDPFLNLSVVATSTPESFYGAADGSVSVSANGGSGNYTYLWNDANNSTSSTVTGLSFGDYTVIVTDNVSNCQFTATTTITAGNQIELNVGSALGTAGTIVQVPVTVSNFNNVTSLTYSIHVVDSNIGTIVGVTTSNLAGAIGNFSGNTATYGWVGNATSLINNTEILSIGIMLTGDVGDNSSVEINGTPVPLDVVIEINGSISVVPVTVNQGMVGIDNAAPTVELIGNIHTSNGENVGNATVNLSGSTTADDLTGDDGNYYFLAPSESEVVLTPEKDILPLEGVNAYDLSLILQHLVMDNSFTSNYTMIAADADNSSNVTAYDLTVLLSLIVNPSTADFGDYNNTSWRFIPEDFSFPAYDLYLDPIPSYPTSFMNTNVQNNTTQNFVGVKIGDVDQSGNPLLLTTPNNNYVDVEIRNSISFNMNDAIIHAGEIIEIPVYASSTFDAIAFQTSIKNTSSLEIIDVLSLNIENFENQNVNVSEEGLTVVWFNDKNIQITEGQRLFTLKVRANNTANLSDNLSIDNSRLSSEVYSQDQSDSNLNLEFNSIQVLETTFALEQNVPNPFKDETNIIFNLPTNDDVILTIFDIKGKIVHTSTTTFTKGKNTITLSKNDIGTSGIYMYQITTSTESAQKKMIIID